MAQDLATVNVLTHDQRIVAQLAALELRILKLEQRAEHVDATAEQLGQIPLRIEWMGTSGGIRNHEDGV